MWVRVKGILKRLSLAQRFMLASLVILIVGMSSIGWWVQQQIEAGIVHRTASTTALYVDSFISPNFQELGHSEALTPGHVETLGKLLQDAALGQQIVAFKVWDKTGRVLYSTDPATVGQVFPMHEALSLALEGQVTSRISDLEDAENMPQRAIRPQLLETYSPIRLSGTNRIIAVAEFYQIIDDMQAELNAAKWRSWLVVGMAMLVMYVLLAGFVQRASDTIARQQVELNQKVVQLTELLGQNRELHERIRRASASVATLNERFLRRISAELHDGPAQDLSLALLRLDHVSAYLETNRPADPDGQQCIADLDIVQSSVQRTLEEVRAISGGLGLPQLGELTLAETLARVVRVHERRTGTKVNVNCQGLPDQVSLPVKITLYRLVQEALTNAYRHAGGLGQTVCLSRQASQLRVEVADQGPGFDKARVTECDEHLGLVGMRERIESLGGNFKIESELGRGTKVMAALSLQAVESTYE